MRVTLYAGAVLAFALASANAQGAGCNVPDRPQTPFQITYSVRSSLPGQPSGVLIDQYWHGENGVGRLVRRSPGQSAPTFADTRNGFITRWHGSRNGRSFEIEQTFEGLDPDIDHLISPRDFSYVMRRRYSFGVEASVSSQARFRGEETVTVGGCSVRVLVWDIEEHERTTLPIALTPPHRTASVWYAPELRAYVRREVRAAGQPAPAQEVLATRIDTRFQPLDMH